MLYNRVIIAKVALNVASEDELYWVNGDKEIGSLCKQVTKDLQKLAQAPVTPFCMDPVALIEAGDSHRLSMSDQDHLIDCHRCASIGQYVSAMPSSKREAQSFSLSA